ncbi:MAG TPA: ergothioneine biosynthesis protein EgtB [Candidatus Angelobacter sp.]|jgi:ergothioneine biosynthesis protein EgtB|nr:ergothioneine biosynthesis protein EgtB [Candidatus Angelobacter sp.]
MAQFKSVLPFPAGPRETGAAGAAIDFQAARAQTQALVASLTPEDQMVQSCPEASPAKWHLAHTTWFFETFILSRHLSGYQPIDPRFRDLFNSYYNAVGPQPEKGLRNTFSRPTLDEVVVYRRHVDEHMELLLDQPDLEDSVLALVTLGINHEQQHQELLVTDVKHAFWTNPLRPAYQQGTSEAPASAAPAQRARVYQEGLFEIGADGRSFGFDNETPRHKVYLKPFRFASRLATCGEYLAFMDDRGYQRPELWLSDGWLAVQSRHWQAPLYWEKSGDDWYVFTCSGVRKLDEHEPVCHVSYYEADAFARWAGARLPNEAEWEVVAANTPVDGNLLEDGAFHPRPAPAAVDDSPAQIFGDVWEWTASAYLPYPGFKPADGALGEYNGKFMVNQMVLRGGSCVTPRAHIRASYRNFFTPEIRWQFSGIRLADDSI